VIFALLPQVELFCCFSLKIVCGNKSVCQRGQLFEPNGSRYRITSSHWRTEVVDFYNPTTASK